MTPLFPRWVAAQESSSRVVRAIEIRGNRIVSADSALAKMKTRTGSFFSQEVLDEDLKRLYRTGFFTDIQMDVEDVPDGVKVVVKVSEQPVIAEIKFSGNRALRDKALLKMIQVKLKEFLDHARLRKDAAALTQAYLDKGFSRADVSYDIALREGNEAAVTFQIEEGERVRIKKIVIEGNKAFPKKRIRKLIKTKEDSLFSSGLLKEQVAEEDLERISAFYRGQGYLDVIVNRHIEYDTAGKRIFLRFTIDEGKQYLVGQTRLEGRLIFPEGEILKTLKMNEGNPFSRDGLRQDIANIQKYYFDKGYINAEINAETFLDELTGRVDLRYQIDGHELTYVREVHIRGNIKTKDVVIRRELRELPGDPFDGEKLKRSRTRLFNLGFFEEVSFDTAPTTIPNQHDLIVEVSERKTGEFSFGAGFSSIDRFIGLIEIAQRNFDWQNPPVFVGDGQDLRVRAQIGGKRQDYILSWTEPWIFDRPVSFGFDAYRAARKRSGTSGFSYDQEQTGGKLRLGKELGEYSRGFLRYKLEEVDISNVQASASAALKAEEGGNTVSSIELTLSRDTRDNIFSPSTGYTASGSVETAGGPLGFDRDFLKYFVSNKIFFPIFGTQHILSIGGRAGLVHAYHDSQSVPIFERFFAGGSNTIRGYQERDVGPKDTSSNDPIGGEGMLVGNVEYLFPIVEILKGAVFYDIGGVWAKTNEFAQGDYRSGAGVGVRVKTPIGPVSLDFGFPLNPDSTQDDNGRLHFNISRSF